MVKVRWFAGQLVKLTGCGWHFEDVIECVDEDHARAIAALQGECWVAVPARFDKGFISLGLYEYHWPPTRHDQYHDNNMKDAAIVRGIGEYMHRRG